MQMMKSIECVTCNDTRSFNRLINYLAGISRYKNFDENMLMNVYVDSDCDLIGFDSKEYRIQFVNNSHKLGEIMMTDVFIEPVPYKVLRSHMLNLG